MALSTPIDWSRIESTLQNWFEEVTGVTTIWSDESEPEEYPCAILKIAGPNKVGGIDEIRYSTDLNQPVGKEVIIKVVGTRNIRVMCQVLVKDPESHQPDKNARHYLAVAQSSLSLPSVLDALYEAGLSVVSEGEIQNNDEGVGVEHISRGSMEVRFALTSYLEERSGFIRKVGISSTGLGKADLNNEIFGEKS